MKIWYDACTGKHIRYGGALTKRLAEKGHEIILTTREHPDTIPLAEFLSLKFKVIGKYDPTSNFTRLYESVMRQLEFCKMFKESPPDVAVSHGSVDLCRVAFGLNIPIISTFDAPHANAVNRLTLPLVDAVVVSEAIPDAILQKYNVKKIIKFKGVDEVAWMKNFRPKMNFNYKKPLIVVRQAETKAAYAAGITDITEKTAKKLAKFGNVIFLSRYERKPQKKLIIPQKFIDSASLAAQADLVVSVGGTISREAALSGTPSIVIKIFDGMYVNEYLAKKGFPIFIVSPEKIIWYAEKYLGKKRDVKALLDSLENPIDIIENVINELTEKGRCGE